MLSQLEERRDLLSARGIGLLAIATTDSSQARRLEAEGVTTPLLLDTADSAREALAIDPSFGTRGLLNPKGALAYIRARGQASRYDARWNLLRARPATVIFDSAGSLHWQYVGQAIGDYPTTDAVLAQTDGLDQVSGER